MSLARDIAMLKAISAIDTSPQFGYRPDDLRQIHMRALTATAHWANESIVQPLLSHPGPPIARASGNGAGTDAPRYRTQSLMDSLDVLPARASAPKPTVYLMVHPNAVDRSKGRRLQLYTRYLETGWTPGRRSGRARGGRVMPNGEDGNTFQRPFANTTEPRPYIKQLFIRNEFDRIQSKYRWEIRRILPPSLKRHAGLFKLEMTYVPPFSFDEYWGTF